MVDVTPKVDGWERRALCLVAALVALSVGVAHADPIDEMSLDRWAKLREVERYQLNVAEKYYRDKQWKIAVGEYEKFVQLYEKSLAAPYAQMKWALCQVELRKANTAIKDGFKTVIDYWPDTPEAVASGYYLARTYRDIGEVKEAKKAYAKLIAANGTHPASVQARMDLIELARRENDVDRQVSLWKELVYSLERTRDTGELCAAASRQLAWHSFRTGSFAEGLKALTTTYKEDKLPEILRHPHLGGLLPALADLASSKEEPTKKLGLRVADDAVAWLRSKVPADTRDEADNKKARQLLFFTADVEGASQRPDLQRAVYEEMVKKFGADDTLLTSIGDWYVNARRYEEARKVYAQFKNPVEGGRLAAASYRTERKFAPAIETYRKLAGLDVKNAAGWMSEAAMTLRHAGQADQAIGVYRELMASDANNAAKWHWEMARTLYDFGRWKEAITALRGTDRFPENNQLMAHANRQLKQFNEAVTLYRQVAAAAPHSAPWALLEIAYTQEQAGQKDAAIKAFKAVCDRYPKSGEASRAHALLQDKYKIDVTLGGTKEE